MGALFVVSVLLGTELVLRAVRRFALPLLHRLVARPPSDHERGAQRQPRRSAAEPALAVRRHAPRSDGGWRLCLAASRLARRGRPRWLIRAGDPARAVAAGDRGHGHRSGGQRGLAHVTAMGGADLQGVPWPAIGALLVLFGAGLSSVRGVRRRRPAVSAANPVNPVGPCRWRPCRGDRGAVIGPDRVEGLTLAGARTAAIVRCVRPESPPAACRPMRSRARHPPVPCPSLRQRVDTDPALVVAPP